MGYPHFPTKTFFMNEQKNIDQGYCLKMIIQNTMYFEWLSYKKKVLLLYTKRHSFSVNPHFMI